MSSDTPTLLVVDDDPAVQRLVEAVACPLGFRVVAERGGRAALALVGSLKPDAALVDLEGMDGAAVLREIHAADPQCHVILMTRSATIEAAISAIKDGALDYLEKPFGIERVRDVLITVCKRLERRETLLRLDADVAKQFEFYGM